MRCLQNQSERHVERLICQSPVAWRLGGTGDRKWDRSGQSAGDPSPEWQVGIL